MKIPKPSATEDDETSEETHKTEVPLPQTLVRIPIEQSGFTQSHNGTEEAPEG